MEVTEIAAPHTDPPDDLDTLVPISHLVIEGLSTDINALAAQLGGDDVFLDSIGRRCTTEARARSLFAERAAAEAQKRAKIKRQEAELQAAGNPTHEWIAAIQAAQKDNPGLLREDGQ